MADRRESERQRGANSINSLIDTLPFMQEEVVDLVIMELAALVEMVAEVMVHHTILMYFQPQQVLLIQVAGVVAQ